LLTFVRGDTGELGTHYAVCYHTVCVAERSNGNLNEHVVFIELLSGNRNVVDLVGFFELVFT
jgi:hypothetical protein